MSQYLTTLWYSNKKVYLQPEPVPPPIMALGLNMDVPPVDVLPLPPLKAFGLKLAPICELNLFGSKFPNKLSLLMIFPGYMKLIFSSE